MKTEISANQKSIPSGIVHGEGINKDGTRQLFAVATQKTERRADLQKHIAAKLNIKQVQLVEIEL